MWIITKYSGIINSNRVIRFAESSNGTYAYCQGAAYMLSAKPILDTILVALRGHAEILEVD